VIAACISSLCVGCYSVFSTAVSFGAKQRYLGASAKNQIVTNAKNTVVLFKHLLGRKFSDPYVQELKKTISCDVVELPNDEIGIKVSKYICALYTVGSGLSDSICSS
jgi:molecular chaperone DnaK (HSP70)